MKAKKATNKVCCDVIGCNEIAKVYLNKSERSYGRDSLKLCERCAKEILAELKVFYGKKEKNDAANAKQV